eukprot:215280_1
MTESLESIQSLDADEIKENVTKHMSPNIIKLNVGGVKYVTTKTTLLKSGYFVALLSGNFAVDLDDEGAYFIDRNGKYFEYILDYMRSGCTVIPSEYKTIVQIESDFFQIKLELNTSQLTQQKLKSLTMPVFVEDCDINPIPIMVNNQWLRQTYKQFGLDAARSNRNNVKWIQTSGGAHINSASAFAIYLVTEKGYEIVSDETKNKEEDNHLIHLMPRKDTVPKHIVILSQLRKQLLQSIM